MEAGPCGGGVAREGTEESEAEQTEAAALRWEGRGGEGGGAAEEMRRR